MSVLDIPRWPDPRLAEPCAPGEEDPPGDARPRAAPPLAVSWGAYASGASTGPRWVWAL